MKTIFGTAPLALALFLGLVQSASAGMMRQEITPSVKLGSSPLPGYSARMPLVAMPAAVMPAPSMPSVVTPSTALPPVVTLSVALSSVVTPAVVTPVPARFFPGESAPTLVPMPAELPITLADPVTVPEPGTVATLAAGLALMAAVVRRRRPAR